MEKKRQDLITCPSCQSPNSPENIECYACSRQLVSDAELLRRLNCEYFNRFAKTCGIGDCLQGCCFLCPDLRTCISRCFKATEKRGLSR